MKKTVLPLSLWLGALPLWAQQKPNIVLFFVDDMGFGDLSYTGANGYTTPNIDQLAANGMFFSQFYSGAPISTASRAGMLTGCYPHRTGVPGAYLIEPDKGLSLDEVTIPEMLKQVGYSTALIGKWHLGMSTQFFPIHQGFDEFFGLPYSNDIWPMSYDGVNLFPSDDPKSKWPELPLYEGDKVVRKLLTMEDQEQLTTLYTERAVKYIREHKDQPFFLEIAHDMPHVPLAVSSKFKGKSHAGLFGDVMMELDWSIGQVMKALKDNGLDDNTLVIFTSDNGPWLTFGNHSGSTGRFREGKQTSFDGGQHVPCIMKWKGVIPEGVVNPQLGCQIDFMATFAEITGASLPEIKTDGVSLLPLLKGETQESPRKYLFYYFQFPQWNLHAVRDDRFKLVFPHYYYRNEGDDVKRGKDGFPGSPIVSKIELSLFDLRMDPGERMNVADQYPEKVAELQHVADAMREDLGDALTGVTGNGVRNTKNEK